MAIVDSNNPIPSATGGDPAPELVSLVDMLLDSFPSEAAYKLDEVSAKDARLGKPISKIAIQKALEGLLNDLGRKDQPKLTALLNTRVKEAYDKTTEKILSTWTDISKEELDSKKIEEQLAIIKTRSEKRITEAAMKTATESQKVEFDKLQAQLLDANKQLEHYAKVRMPEKDREMNERVTKLALAKSIENALESLSGKFHGKNRVHVRNLTDDISMAYDIAYNETTNTLSLLDVVTKAPLPENRNLREIVSGLLDGYGVLIKSNAGNTIANTVIKTSSGEPSKVPGAPQLAEGFKKQREADKLARGK